MGLLDMIIGWIGWDGMGWDWIGWDRIIGYSIWMVFFLPNSDVTCGPQGHSSQGRFFFVVTAKFLKMVIFGQKK